MLSRCVAQIRQASRCTPFARIAHIHIRKIHNEDTMAWLSAPNGLKWKQPTGLFINNRYIRSSHDVRQPTTNPLYVIHPYGHILSCDPYN